MNRPKKNPRKLIKNSILTVATLISFNASAGAMSLAEKLAELGDSHLYIKEKNCDSIVCGNFIPYEVEIIWPLSSESKKKRQLARNLESRNKWMLTHGNYPTVSEIKAKSLKKSQRALEKQLTESRKQALKAEKELKKRDRRLIKLREKGSKLTLKKKQLFKKVKATFLSADEAVVRGRETFASGAGSVIKGQMPLFSSKAEEKSLVSLEENQEELRSVMKDMRDLGGEVQETINSGEQAKSLYSNLAGEIGQEQSRLDKIVSDYGEAISKVKSEKEQDAAQIKLINQKSAIEAARDFSEAKIKELKEKEKMADFILSEFKDIKRDLKLSELEAKFLEASVNSSIEKSIIGRYIREQNEKTLNAAMQGACTNAKLCAEHASISNSNVIKTITPVFEKVKGQLGKEK